MAKIVVNFLDRRQLDRYVILNREMFELIVRSRLLAAAVMGYAYWISEARNTFSKSTSSDYLRGLYWDPSATNEVVLGIKEGTLSNTLEQGIDTPFDMKPMLLKGRSHRRIPILVNKDLAEGFDRKVPTESSVFSLLQQTAGNPRAAILSLIGAMKRNELASASMEAVIAKNTRNRGTILSEGSVNIRTVSINSPASSWVHPGFRAANIAHKVASYLSSVVVPRLTSDLFNESGVVEYE